MILKKTSLVSLVPSIHSSSFMSRNNLLILVQNYNNFYTFISIITCADIHECSVRMYMCVYILIIFYGQILPISRRVK